MLLRRIELGTFSVYNWRDNHYTAAALELNLKNYVALMIFNKLSLCQPFWKLECPNPNYFFSFNILNFLMSHVSCLMTYDIFLVVIFRLIGQLSARFWPVILDYKIKIKICIHHVDFVHIISILQNLIIFDNFIKILRSYINQDLIKRSDHLNPIHIRHYDFTNRSLDYKSFKIFWFKTRTPLYKEFPLWSLIKLN